MKLYKLTDADGYTYNRQHWEIGQTVSVDAKISRDPPKLCTSRVLHAYTSPLLAALMNPAHGDYKNPRAYTVSGDVVVSDGTKVGCLTLTVTGTFELPTLTASQRVAFGVLTALAVYSEESFHVWGKNWLSGADRSAAAANANAAAIDFEALAQEALK